MKDTSEFEQLLSCLQQVSQGPVTDAHVRSEIGRHLATCWDELEGSEDGGMKAYKLTDRIETVTWNAPILEFDIERHGAVVYGSIYATVQHWVVNLSAKVAQFTGESRRQIGVKDRVLKVQPLVDQVVEAIRSNTDAEFLKRTGENKVRILIAKIIPVTNNQTTAERRKRFWKAFPDMSAEGWTLKGSTLHRNPRALEQAS